MLDVLEVLLPPDLVALDLGCGPGSLSRRLLDRFPRAHVVALDMDPVLMTIGQNVHGTVGGRLRWVDADLADPTWSTRLGVESVDAVLSTTALHWLTGDVLVRVYRQLGKLVREGGVFLDGDTIRFPPQLPTVRRLAAVLENRLRQDSHEQRGLEDWEGWWAALETESALAEQFAERRRRFAWRPLQPGKRFSGYPSEGDTSPVIDLHEAGLRNAGFREVATIWQRVESRVLVAIR
ncbi:MAG TPA: class I SAM-dependent methyltransferase [Candidatus Acidoferrum sp.]|nr:class I SAM-dependent methyltransferase [Candidatus Acidoferrum sp.]